MWLCDFVAVWLCAPPPLNVLTPTPALAPLLGDTRELGGHEKASCWIVFEIVDRDLLDFFGFHRYAWEMLV